MSASSTTVAKLYVGVPSVRTSTKSSSAAAGKVTSPRTASSKTMSPRSSGHRQAPHVRLAGIDAGARRVSGRARGRCGRSPPTRPLRAPPRASLRAPRRCRSTGRRRPRPSAARARPRSWRRARSGSTARTIAADLGALVPVEAEPAQRRAGSRAVFSAVDRSGSVSSMRRMNVPPTSAGEGPVVDGGAGAADVQVAGRARGESDAYVAHRRCLLSGRGGMRHRTILPQRPKARVRPASASAATGGRAASKPARVCLAASSAHAIVHRRSITRQAAHGAAEGRGTAPDDAPATSVKATHGAKSRQA